MHRRSFFRTALGGLTAPVLFTFLPARPAVLRFAVASDGHFGQPGTEYEKDFARLNKWLAVEKSKRGLDAVFINGDLFHDDPVFLPRVRASFAAMPAPHYVTRGNHDRVSLATWEQTWGYPSNHDLLLGDYACLLADTSNEKGEYLCPDPEWLARTLQKHADKKGIFVFMHIPPNKRWTEHGADCASVQALLEKTPNLLAVFHGHDHDIDDRKMSGGKPHFFDGHFGGSWGTAYKGYRIVEVYADGTWQSYQYNPAASPLINTHQGKGGR